MSTRRRPGREKSDSAPRNKVSVLSIAFAIAMAFFLVIGMVAVALPQFIGGGGGNGPEAPDVEEPPSIQEQGEGEEQELRDRIDEDPNDISARSQLAVLLANSGRLEEAIPHYEEVLNERPDDVELRLSFAQALERQGYTLDAEIQLERVLEDDAENAEAIFLLAEIKEQDADVPDEESTELYERVIEIEPDSYYAEMARDRLGETEGADSAPQAPEDEGDESAPGDDQG